MLVNVQMVDIRIFGPRERPTLTLRILSLSLSLLRLVIFTPRLTAFGTAAAVTAAAVDAFFAGTVTLIASFVCSCRHIRILIGCLEVESDSPAWQ